MPLFNYVCQACHSESEILVRGAEPPVCPSCGSKRLAKQASVFAPVTAGSGARDQAPAPCGAGGRCPGGACPYSK